LGLGIQLYAFDRLMAADVEQIGIQQLAQLKIGKLRRETLCRRQGLSTFTIAQVLVDLSNQGFRIFGGDHVYGGAGFKLQLPAHGLWCGLEIFLKTGG
jgi:hypothetical protein